jgi:putative resolvase
MPWKYETIKDIGSGINYNKKGLTRLIELITTNQVKRLVLTHKDRLLRFGAEIIFALCSQFAVEVVILNRPTDSSPEQDLVQDVLEIITVFSARLYGLRSHQNKVLIDELEKDNKKKLEKLMKSLLRV